MLLLQLILLIIELFLIAGFFFFKWLNDLIKFIF